MSGRTAPVRGRSRFRALVRSPHRARSGAVTVHFLPSDDEPSEVRVAFAIGRKVGGAVVRNLWRRRLRAIAAELRPELRRGDYLIGVGPDVRSVQFDELREKVTETMSRASRVRR